MTNILNLRLSFLSLTRMGVAFRAEMDGMNLIVEATHPVQWYCREIIKRHPDLKHHYIQVFDINQEKSILVMDISKHSTYARKEDHLRTYTRKQAKKKSL